MYQYGGLYLDTDAILLRPLPQHDNYAGVESWDLHHLEAGVVKFQKHHPVIRSILNTLANTFSGSEWSANGPLVLEGELRMLCEDEGRWVVACTRLDLW